MNILNDSGLLNLNTVLNLKTYFAKEYLESYLSKQSTFPNIESTIKVQKVIEELRNLNDSTKDTVFSIIQKLVDNEKDLQFFFDEENSLESLEKDTFGQLLFQHYDLKIFNTFPFLIMILSYMKIYFIPIVSIAIPFIMYFLPYFLIKYVWNLPMTYEMYQKIMGQMVSFSFDGSIEKMLQNMFTIFTIGQSMYQPIQNALHLNTINSTIYNLGESLYEYSSNISKLNTLLKDNSISFEFDNTLDKFISANDYRRNFSYILDNSLYLHILSYSISKFEILHTLANSNRFKKVQLYQSETPYLNIKNCVDINLNENSCVGSDYLINQDSNHFLLSGPNGGGKSSFLRAVLQTVLFSQSFGYAICDSAEISVFDYIFSGLHIQDIPGEKSLFEKEVCFARDVLCFSNPKYKALVLFDEIFHSTNPPDGIKTAKKFLEKLHSYKHISSIISTHVFEIIENSPDFVKRICVNANIKNNKLVYNYKLSEGICKTSSVSQIWKKEFT